MSLNYDKMFEDADKAVRKNNYERAIELYKKILDSNNRESIMVARNLLGKIYESTGQISDAENLYNENVAEGFAGTHPYKRLAIIFKREKRKEDELNILRHAIDFFQQYYNEDPSKVLVIDTISYFKSRLDKALKKKSKR